MDSKLYSKDLINFVNACMTYEEQKRPSILDVTYSNNSLQINNTQLIPFISERIMEYANKLCENEEILRFEMNSLKKKM